MSQTFAILRTEKLKSPAAIRGAGGHNDRTRDTPNADPRRQNRTLVDGGDDPYETVLARIARAGVRNPRSNAVLAQEVLLTASPQYFRPDAPEAYGQWDEGRMEQWFDAAWSWLQDQYGDRIVSAHLHLDEATPHIQAIVVPLTNDNRLSARDMFSRWQLRDMQTSYAEALSHLGLQRGIRGSTAKHQDVKRFYEAVNKSYENTPRITVSTPNRMLSEWKRDEWADRETHKVRNQTYDVTARATNANTFEREAKTQQRTNAKLSAELEREKAERKRLADEVRDIPLEQVLERAGWDRDHEDKQQWRGPNNNGRISINGHKWYDHDAQSGGGKAIDLAKHLTGHDFTGAVSWLAETFGADGTAAAVRAAAPDQVATAQAERRPLQIPPAVDSTWSRVRRYLVETRKLTGHLVDHLHKVGVIYGDARANLVALMRHRPPKNTPCGAELKGTGTTPFASLAPGSSRNAGYFSVAVAGTKKTDPLVLVESAIDAMSYLDLFNKKRRFVVVSTAGARPRVPWLPTDRPVVVAYDNDKAGNAAAEALIASHPGPISRDVPPAKRKDWNDYLQFQRQRDDEERKALEGYFGAADDEAPHAGTADAAPVPLAAPVPPDPSPETDEPDDTPSPS